jgi:XRE family aerobic/anaerobic benzoate catabolism transcriptional regulator
MASRASPGGRSARTKADRDHARRLRALAARVRRLRADRGLTQRAAALRIGIGPPALRRLEAGIGNPSLAVLVSVARAFDVPLGYLFGKRGKRE